MTGLPDPYWTDGQATIYHGDCRDLLPLLTEHTDLVVVTDPPYGVEAMEGRHQPGHTEHRPIEGDGDTELARFLLEWLPADMPAAVFGANNFPGLLPHRGRWVCWDKRLTEAADRMMGSAFELAWLNRHTGYDRMLRCLHGGVVNANGHGLKRVHPTEKPVPMLRQLIGLVGAGTVLDPFMGSGTTLRAAADLGLPSIGIETDEQYCATAVDRLAQQVLDFQGA